MNQDKKKYVDEVLSKVDEMINNGVYKSLPDGCSFSTEFPTYIIAYCPDVCSWFVTNTRFYYFEYEKEFDNEEDAIRFFKDNAKLFYDLEIRMNGHRPDFYNNTVILDRGGPNIDYIEID